MVIIVSVLSAAATRVRLVRRRSEGVAFPLRLLESGLKKGYSFMVVLRECWRSLRV